MEDLLKKDDELFIEKDKHKFLKIFITIFLILGIIGGGGYYYYTNYYNNPHYTISQIFKTAKKNFTNNIQSKDETTKYKINALLKMEIESKTKVSQSDQDIYDIINDLSLQINAELDTKLDTYNITLGSKYKDEDFININYYQEDKKAYVKLINLFDKYIKLNEDDISNELSNNNIKASDIENIGLGFMNSFEKIINQKKFTRTKEKITINNEEISVFKDCLTFKGNEFKNFINDIIKDLQNNAEFTHSYKKLFGQDLTTMDSDITLEEDYELCFYTTTNPFNTKLVSIQLNEKYNNQTISFIIDIQDNELDLRIVAPNGLIEMNIKRNENNTIFEIKADIQDMIVTLKINLSKEAISSISKPDLSNAIDINDLTEEDQKSINEKLEANKALLQILDKIQKEKLI